MYSTNTVLIILFTAIVFNLIWARFRVFTVSSKKSRLGALIYDPIVAIQIGAPYWYWLFPSFDYQGYIDSYIAVLVLLFSLLLFIWSLKTAKNMNFALGEPKLGIITSGPFAIVRHPFYLSYILIWLCNTLLFNSLILWITLTYLIAFYIFSARSEEKAILKTEYSREYREYRNKVGMFLPRIAIWKS